MSLKDKKYYFLTNHSTFFRYLVDNSSGNAHHYLFYPKRYETMSASQIGRFERRLCFKLVWWSVFNGAKMVPYDRQVCVSKAIDCAAVLLFTLGLGRVSRLVLFRHQFMEL
jgi:hypothetical protein